MKINKSILITIIFAASCFISKAQTDSLSHQLDTLIAQSFPSISPGCVVLVAKNNSIIYEKAFGVANIELNVPMKPEMIFRLGSVTKQYTAVSILQLVEQGKISLQDSIQKFIKDFPYKGHTITIENLLTHTSGIVDYEVLDFHIPNGIRIDFPAKQIIDSLSKLPLDFTPSSQFHYSNSNYFLLAYIIEQVSGKSYQDYLTENIFKPAGLTNTFYDSPTDIIPNRISGYAKYGGKYFNAGYISMSQVYGAGALISNVEEIFKWHEALYNYKLIKKETSEKAVTPFTLSDGKKSSYGYGWFIKNRNDYTSIEHAGGIDGFQSDEIYFPEQNIFIATLYNSLNEGGDDPAFAALDNSIATLSVGKKLEQEIKVDTNFLKQYVGQYDFDKKHHAYITLENGQLQIEAPQGGLPKVPLFPKSKNVFFLKIMLAEIEFTKDENGNISQMIVHVNGENQICKKVK